MKRLDKLKWKLKKADLCFALGQLLECMLRS